MLTWILYVLVITLVLSGAALAAERAARLRRARSRWIWAVTIVASLAVPTFIASVSIQVPSLLTPTVSHKATALRELTSVQVVPLTWVHEHTRNIVATHRENRVLQRTWSALSVMLLGVLALNGAYVFWRKRRWKVGTVAGICVYIARTLALLRPGSHQDGNQQSRVSLGMRPMLVRKPKTLFQPAGLRRLPPKSEPSAAGNIRSASPTAAPPLLPPADRVKLQAFRVAP
jgi:hypothetical protein